MGFFDWSKTASNNATVDDIDFAEGQTPGSVNNSARALMKDAAEARDDQGGALTLAGGTTAYTLTTNSSLSSIGYKDGQRLHAVCNAANTGASTLNVDAVGVKDIKKIIASGEADLDANDMLASGHYIFEYDVSADSAAGAWVLLNPSTIDTGALTPTFTDDITAKTSDGAILTLQTSEATVVDNDVLGRIDFQAPDEADGTDAILVGAAIWAEASGTFGAADNPTDLVFATAESEAAVERARLYADGTFDLEDNTLKKPKLLDYGETVNALGSIGGGTQDIDLTLGNVVTGAVDTSTTTFTFSNPSASGTACSFTLQLQNGGSQTVNWPASVTWAGGAAPTLTASGIDVLTFFTVDGGTTWRGFAAGLDMS